MTESEHLPAGFASRAVATVIDALIITAGLTVAVAAIAITLDLLSESFRREEFSVAPLVAELFVPTVFVLYQAAFWSLAGRTPGKAVMGVHVLTLEGERLGFARSVLRVLAYGISMILFLGFLWVLVDDRRMAWHDKIARTWVVYDSGSEDEHLGGAAPG